MLPLLLLSGVVPVDGVAIVPMAGIVLGGTMTAVAVAARRALDTLGLRAGEVDAALSLGFTDRDAAEWRLSASPPPMPCCRISIKPAPSGSLTLPGAFVGVLLARFTPASGAVQILILLALLLSQTCAVATTIELIARGVISRDS